MLQQDQNIPLAVYTVARDLNIAYDSQKDHRLGDWFTAERRGLSPDYNLLLRLLKRLRLEEIAALNYNFCKRYEAQMTGYAGFEKEMEKAREKLAD